VLLLLGGSVVVEVTVLSGVELETEGVGGRCDELLELAAVVVDWVVVDVVVVED